MLVTLKELLEEAKKEKKAIGHLMQQPWKQFRELFRQQKRRIVR